MFGRVCLVLLCFCSLLPFSVGFAAWLKCTRYLEEDEVIMNNKVRKVPSEGQVAKLAVYDASGSRVDVPSDEDDGDSIVWIDPKSSRSQSFTISMDAKTIEGLSDVQYVVETTPFQGLKGAKSEPPSRSPAPSHGSHPSPTPMIPTVHSIPPESSFVSASGGGGILCDGRRGHARGKKGSVKYVFVPNSEEDTTEILAEIVAGYSEYHGPVTLTPRVLFKRQESKAESHPASQGEL